MVYGRLGVARDGEEARVAAEAVEERKHHRLHEHREAIVEPRVED